LGVPHGREFRGGGPANKREAPVREISKGGPHRGERGRKKGPEHAPPPL